MSLDFHQHIFCVITDGCQELGQKIAEEFARRAEFITFLLIAKNEAGLSETKTCIEQINKHAVIFCKSLDLPQPDEKKFRQVLTNSFQSNLYETVIIIHNAVQIGQVDKASAYSVEMWEKCYDLHLFSVILFNSLCLEVMKDIGELFIINITSQSSNKPMKYLSMYGSCEAARDTYFKVLALEEPEITVLNYSFGMDDKLMKAAKEEIVKGYFETEQLSVDDLPSKLTAEQITLKLISILEVGNYSSGDFVDYYDK